jgi:pyruvate dehydrogenase E2 component (dihydrolipoamide acetyltransferase)
MATIQQITVPDIGDFKDVEIIEVLVKVGDAIAPEDSLLTLESDKATMDVPSPQAGTVSELLVNVGDRVSEGSAILTLEVSESAAPVAEAPAARTSAPSPVPSPPTAAAPVTAAPAAVPSVQDLLVPDIGDFKDVEIIEIFIKAGDVIEAESSLITLESDKATMEVPASFGGTIQEVLVKVGDRVSEGSAVAKVLTAGSAPAPAPTAAPPPAPVAERPAAPAPAAALAVAAPTPAAPVNEAEFRKAHASPSIRKFARELGVDLSKVSGSGRKGRITRDDVQGYVKQAVQTAEAGVASAAPATASGSGIPQMPEVDFSKFGPIETQALSRIKKLTGKNLHRVWLNVPAVTHHDEADITDLEAFRKALKDEAAKQGVRITLLAFIMKALAANLQKFPTFNASLSPDGATLILKQYFNIGVAVDTPNGLVVPVVRDVDQKSVYALANDLGTLSAKARDGKLSSADMQGGCMTISSLGGIGGTAFTPIVNAPEVAILGLTRSRMQPIWNGKEFVPRLMQPLDLSYDHRVIDGAEAARFVASLCTYLSDIRRVLL